LASTWYEATQALQIMYVCLPHLTTASSRQLISRDTTLEMGVIDMGQMCSA